MLNNYGTYMYSSANFRSSAGSLVLTIFCAGLAGCSMARATGDTFEAVGVGVGQALTGFSSGAGHIIAGTGRAMSKAAGETGHTVSKAAHMDAAHADYDNRSRRDESDLTF